MQDSEPHHDYMLKILSEYKIFVFCIRILLFVAFYSLCSFVCLFVCLFDCLFVYLFVYLFVCLICCCFVYVYGNIVNACQPR